MGMEAVIALARQTLQTALWMGAPLLVIVMLVSLLINIGQVLTSLQDVTISTIPRLAVVGITTFLLLPWMLRKMVMFTVHLFSDFRPFTN